MHSLSHATAPGKPDDRPGYPDGEFDPDGRIRRSWMRAIERGVRAEVIGLVEAHDIHREEEFLLERAQLAWSRMDRAERADFAEWCDFLGYQPGTYAREPADPARAWGSFVLECIAGSPRPA